MSNKDTSSKKSTPEKRALELCHLDRTEGYANEHYSWQDVAEACHSSEGCSHE